MIKVFLCFIVYVYIFIYVSNTCVIVTGSCHVYTVNKEGWRIKNWEMKIQRPRPSLTVRLTVL